MALAFCLSTPIRLHQKRQRNKHCPALPIHQDHHAVCSGTPPSRPKARFASSNLCSLDGPRSTKLVLPRNSATSAKMRTKIQPTAICQNSTCLTPGVHTAKCQPPKFQSNLYTQQNKPLTRIKNRTNSAANYSPKAHNRTNRQRANSMCEPLRRNVANTIAFSQRI